MNSTAYFVTILLAALATYLTRFPSLLLGRSLSIPPRILQGLRYIPIGVFAALVAPSIVLHQTVQGHLDYTFWGASIVAFFTAWRTKSPLWTMISGVIVIAGLRVVLETNG
jgi:branched-subunit amino acid transport protein